MNQRDLFSQDGPGPSCEGMVPPEEPIEEPDSRDHSDDVCPCGDPDCSRPFGHDVHEEPPAPIVKKVNRVESDPIRDLDRRLSRSGTQGKCPRCRECYRWHSRRPLRMAYCPECGTKLQGTTHLNGWPWNVGVEPLTEIQAWAKFKKT